MKIQSIKPKKGRASRVTLRFADDTRLEIASEVAVRAGLRPGDELQASDIQALERGDAAWRCKESALRLLSYRPRSEHELRQRLAARAFPHDVVDGCISALARAGLIDDAEFARLLTRDRVRGKPVGKVRLRAELRAKGVDSETAGAAIDEAVGGDSGGELELARRAAAKFRRREGEDVPSARRRLYGYLARRGFPSDAIGTVLDEVIPHASGDS